MAPRVRNISAGAASCTCRSAATLLRLLRLWVGPAGFAAVGLRHVSAWILDVRFRSRDQVLFATVAASSLITSGIPDRPSLAQLNRA